MGGKVAFLNIVCFKWGTAYPTEEVNILRAMIDRNLSVPHVFHCITDDPRGLDEGIIVHELPDIGVTDVRQKLIAFTDNFLGLNGQYAAFFDIDMVIVGSLDFLADDPEKDLIIVRNWKNAERPEKRYWGNSTLYRLKIGSHTEVWERFAVDLSQFPGADQDWISHNVDDLNYFPEEKVVSFKYHCKARSFKFLGTMGAKLGMTTAHFGSAETPPGTAVVSFHGQPKPHHVRDRRYRHWKHARFVQDHWRK